jgi:calcineurin-like phosphoesterase family protein
MTKQFITSDIHFSHERILEYNSETRGAFKDTQEMNEEIIRRWNTTIGTDDHVFVLGDMFMGNVQQHAVPILNRLNGSKTLILGNHDRSLMKIPGIESFFHGVFDYLCYEYSHKQAVIMFHYPIQNWDGKYRGSIHLHGHCHGAPTGIQGKIKDIGMDCNNLYPFCLDDLVKTF